MPEGTGARCRLLDLEQDRARHVKLVEGAQTCVALTATTSSSPRSPYYYLRHHELTLSSCELKAGNVFDNAN